MNQSTILIPVPFSTKNLARCLSSLQKTESEIILLLMAPSLMPMATLAPSMSQALKPALAPINKKSTKNPALSIQQEAEKFSRSNKNVRALSVSGSLAQALNQGLQQSQGKNILFLSPEATIQKSWEKAMLSALEQHSLIVGKTISQTNTSAYGKLAQKLFLDHSERTSQAKGHALPWGALSNLGARREIFQKVGDFSQAASSALDIDWCWRAVLSGAQIHFQEKATIKLQRESDRESLLHIFEQFGLAESWLHRSFSFLTEEEAQSPLQAALNAFERLRHHSRASKVKSLQKPLEEVSVAFSSGVRSGLDGGFTADSFKREANISVGWFSEKNEATIFVPGKGLATLKGKQIKLWQAMARGATQKELRELFAKTFKISDEIAQHEVDAFREALTP